MLSLWKLRVGAENYYLSQVANGLEDYYTGRGEMPGRWLGAAAPGSAWLGARSTATTCGRCSPGSQPGTGLTPNGGRSDRARGGSPAST